MIKFISLFAQIVLLMCFNSCENIRLKSEQNAQQNSMEISDSLMGLFPLEGKVDSIDRPLTLADSTYCKIYCFCFATSDSIGKSTVAVSLCLTPAKLKLEEILDRDNLMVDVRNESHVASIGSVLKNYTQSGQFKSARTSSLVVLLKLRGQLVDTFQYMSERAMLYNNSYAVNYPFSVLGMLAAKLHRRTLNCGAPEIKH